VTVTAVRRGIDLRGRWSNLVSAAVAHAPENAAYGLVALAPLGAAWGPQAMAYALVGSIVACTVAGLLGAGHLVSGPRASLALLTAGLAAQLVRAVEDSGHAGEGQAVAAVLLLMALALVLGGLFQIAFGVLRLGSVVKYTPYPVRVGLTTGVGLVLVASALPVTLGHGFGSTWSALAGPAATGAALVGCSAAAVGWLAARRASRLPPMLLGLGAAAVLSAALWAGLLPWEAPPSIGIPSIAAPAWWGHEGAPALAWTLVGRPQVLGLLLGWALTVAVLGSLDTLLAGSVIDGRLRQGRNANRELVAQGSANIASALAGGLAASPSLPRSMALVAGSQARPRDVLPYALLLLTILLLAPQAFALVPESALGGVLLAQGLMMISPSLWRTPAALWRRRQARSAEDERQRRLMAANWAVTAVVAVNALALGLGPAVLIGASFAVLLFVRSNMRDVVRRVWTGQTRRSLKMRPAAAVEQLQEQGHEIVLLELEGPLFFGTADALRARLQAVPDEVHTVILDLHQVPEIDITAARILSESADDRARAGRALVFAEWPLRDGRRMTLESVAGAEGTAALRFTDDADTALEQAENALLERLSARAAEARALTLAETQLGRGLTAQELQRLSQQMQTVRFGRGSVMFRAGDPGDALYVSLRGEIGLRLPGSGRRLACFAPGVTIGEMAVLSHGRRSAEAYAETDVEALRLSVQAFDALRTEDPDLAATLLTNIALHLADRVRILTADLGHWVSRSAARVPQTDTGPGTQPEDLG
jgi:SulP family sulfate permease